MLSAASSSRTSGAAHLPDDEAVGTHPQGLPDEVDEGHGSPTLDVRRAALETDDMRMSRIQLADVLDEDEPLLRPALGEEGGQDRRLARPRPTTDDERHLGVDEGPQHHGHSR